MDEEEIKKDTIDRVAVFITDGERILVGRAPQSHGYPNGYDLPKGHLQEGEDPVEGAKREVYEETGLELVGNLIKIATKIPYMKGTNLTFYLYRLDNLPSLNELKCLSTFDFHGKQTPEIVAYQYIPINDITMYLYKGLSRIVKDYDLINKINSNV